MPKYTILYIKVQCHDEKNAKISVQLTKIQDYFIQSAADLSGFTTPRKTDKD